MTTKFHFQPVSTSSSVAELPRDDDPACTDREPSARRTVEETKQRPPRDEDGVAIEQDQDVNGRPATGRSLPAPETGLGQQGPQNTLPGRCAEVCTSSAGTQCAAHLRCPHTDSANGGTHLLNNGALCSSFSV